MCQEKPKRSIGSEPQRQVGGLCKLRLLPAPDSHVNRPNHSLTDRLLSHVDEAMRTLWATPKATRANPAADKRRPELSDLERRHTAGLMRINHTGEVCAQALYLGQAAGAKDPHTKNQLLAAAAEETDHLAWCAEILEELDSSPSAFNPLWYAGSFAIGAMAAAAGDRWSLGFVVETERQVEAHLQDHLEAIPSTDDRSRAVLETMREDEARHADNAQASGGSRLPEPVARLMAGTARIMKAVAYRI